MMGRRTLRLLLMSGVSMWIVAAGPSALSAADQTAAPAAGSDVGQEDLWASIVENMRRSEAHLRDGDVSEQTQRLQQQVIDQLDRMLQSLPRTSADSGGQAAASRQATSQTEQQRVGMSQSATGESETGKPSSRAGTAPAELEQPEGIMEFHRRLMVEVWGQLPAQLQQRIQSPLHEQFLPQYESLIRDYYRRLAEESER